MRNPNFVHSLARVRLACLTGMIAALLVATSAVALAVPYNVTHQFRLQPGGTVVPLVFHHFNIFTQVIENGAVVDTQVSPPPASPVPLPGAAASEISDTAVGTVGSFAEGHSFAQLTAPPAAGQAVSGTIRAFGETQAVTGGSVNQASTRAFSSAQVEARGGRPMGKGQIQWKPVFSSIAAGGPGLFVDPIFFEVVDLTSGAVLSSGDLLSIVGDVSGPGSQISWDDTGLVSVNASDAHFSINIPGNFTTQQGALALQIAGGLVTLADDSGLFDGLLPAVGSPGNFSFLAAGPGGLLLDYDTGFFAATDDGKVGINLNFANSGEANDAAVPEPSSLAGMGAGLLALAALSWLRRRGVGRRWQAWRQWVAMLNRSLSGLRHS
jgi:hypothetical protein